jgi:hypothetical protein
VADPVGLGSQESCPGPTLGFRQGEKASPTDPASCQVISWNLSFVLGGPLSSSTQALGWCPGKLTSLGWDELPQAESCGQGAEANSGPLAAVCCVVLGLALDRWTNGWTDGALEAQTPLKQQKNALIASSL